MTNPPIKSSTTCSVKIRQFKKQYCFGWAVSFISAVLSLTLMLVGCAERKLAPEVQYDQSSVDQIRQELFSDDEDAD